MSNIVMKVVDCFQDGKLIASYPLSYGVTLVPPVIDNE